MSHAADPSSGAQPTIRRRQPGISGWSLAAVLCSSVLVCPPLPVLGILLGLRAWFHVKATPGRRGKGLAVAAIVLGLLATIWWGYAATWWNRNARRPMREGPIAAFVAGQAGNNAAFARRFTDESDGAAERAAAFLRQVTAHHGPLRAISQGEATGVDGAVLDGGRAVIPYTFHFQEGDVEGQAEFVVAEGGRLRLRFAWVELDSPAGTLRYP